MNKGNDKESLHIHEQLKTVHNSLQISQMGISYYNWNKITREKKQQQHQQEMKLKRL